MGTTAMPESGHGAWWSYPIYAAGLFVGVLSPEQWLVFLSIVAVVIRIANDASPLIAKISRWWSAR